MISCSHKDKERADLKRLVQEYLDKGGAITVCPQGKRSRVYQVSDHYLDSLDVVMPWSFIDTEYVELGEGSYQKKGSKRDS